MTYTKDNIVFVEKPKGTNFRDLEGVTCGRLVVLGYGGRRANNSMWYAECDCGTIILTSLANLSQNHSQSCGCLRSKVLADLRRTHNLSKTHPLYNTWILMRRRCLSPKLDAYKDYGGRGIKICERWDDFTAFIVDMGERPDGMTLERKNNNGDYTPDNCIWADGETQGSNKRNNVNIEYNGQTRTLAQWCRELKLNYKVTHCRLKRGFSVERAFSGAFA